MNGVERIAAAFAGAVPRAALMPYLMGGFPDLPTSQAIAQAYVDSGADLIELGVPFSDPLADGPVIAAAGTAALRAGATFRGVLEIAAAVGEKVPVLVMAYANAMLAHGIVGTAELAARAAASGLIIPDLPLEESDELRGACDERGLALVPLVAPTTPEERLRKIGAAARGFLYTVSAVGTTGERPQRDAELSSIIARTAASTSVPIAVGFGIGSAGAAAGAARAGADGVIVGTRLVRAAAEADPGSEPEAVGALVAEMRVALSEAAGS